MIVLDTHALVFWVQQPEYLGAGAAGAIESADEIGIAAISFWEVSLLWRKQWLVLADDLSPADWMATVLSIPRVVSLPMTAEIAVAADALAMHADPADRFIVATAIACPAPLVTRDELLRGLSLVETVW